jgi:CHASE2 domain
MEFLLEVWQIGHTCLFKLSWGNGHSLDARMPLLSSLPQYYQDWATAYHKYYVASRGRPGVAMTIPSTAINWETRLNFTQDQLINEFRGWLRGRELFELRQVLLDAAQGDAAINLLIQCQDDYTNDTPTSSDFSLAKLPWESFGQELSDRGVIQVLRTTSQRPVIVKRSRRSRLRILAIFGDDTGLDFAAERAAIEQRLKPIAEVQFAGYNISSSHVQNNLKAQIKQAIEDPRGWDILFFAGHSDDGLGGEVMLAPGYSALISEFEDSLKMARDRGLQFALFNSCRGCAIAEQLIAYGLSHVVVMRERVTNQVAQVFFQEFADRLANLQDVQTAALGAIKALAIRARDRYQYPSAYLVPSIYAYTGVKPLQPPTFNWRVLLALLNPTRREVIVLTALAILSIQSPIQYFLIDWRQTTQASYRQVGEVLQETVNGPRIAPAPPILVVKLDDDSLQAAKANKDPIDRGYIAKLMQKTISLKIPVVGIDYVLKDAMPQQEMIQQAIVQGQANRDKASRFVFGASATWGVAHPNAVHPDVRIDGDISVNDVSNHPVFLARTIGDPTIIKGSEATPHALPHQLLCQYQQQPANCRLADSRAYYNPITAFSRWFEQQWLNPWIDYSIPIAQVYQPVTAQAFLQQSAPPQQSIALLVPSEEFDGFQSPIVFKDYQRANPSMAGGEVHAYLLYNLLRQGLIIPIPDLWMIGLVGIVSKLLTFWLQQRPQARSPTRRGWAILLGIGPLVAYVIILQTYIGLGVAIPWLLPILTYYSYLLPQWYRQHRRPRRL